MEEEAGMPVYESSGILYEMFNFPASELLDSQRVSASDWFLHRAVRGCLGESKHHDVVDQSTASYHHHQQHQILNADSAAAAMQLNPQPQKSPSPSPSASSSSLNLLLPNHPPPSSFDGAFGQFTWLPSNPNQNPGEGQGLSLSLSSSLEAEELRMKEGGMPFFGSSSLQSQSPQFSGINILRNSKYAKAAQELLEEFCSVGGGEYLKNIKSGRQENNRSSATSNSKDLPPLSASDRLEHQRRKIKLLTMLDELERRYNHYCEQMQMVVNSFDMIMGYAAAAAPYTSLAQKAMSRHFRCLKDAVAGQLRASGLTKGETPRLKMLEQRLRQQRGLNQMGMMEQEAWRPQRSLPERSVNVLRAWLFDHFLHPYPSDADKHVLARQTGLSRNQVSNWFINARVRLWKPMVEEMYLEEFKQDPNRTPTPPPPTDGDPSFASIGAEACRQRVRFGDVSLTLGLRHAGNPPENPPFPLAYFGSG